MQNTERQTANYLTALQGEKPCLVAGHRVRRVSIETLGVLQLIGSPFAAAFNGALDNKRTPLPSSGPLDIAVMAWVHAEDPDKVLDVALQCAPGAEEPAYRAALQFTREWSIQSMYDLLGYATSELTALRASGFDVAAPELPGATKKKDAPAAPANSPC